jgi:Secretion system C-terminal sorting domain
MRTKRIISKTIISLLFALACAVSTTAQDLILNPISENTSPTKHSVTSREATVRAATASISDTISLGINGLLDDFSAISSIPDTAIWLDKQVYINRGYGKSPVSLGVATFDGLDEFGYPYNFLVSSTSSNPADTITSKPIDLNYPVGDSIYLSFYVQPQGIGNAPQTNDSLVLEFRMADSTKWTHAWSSPGKALVDSAWNLVMISIINPLFLKKGFQFRFRNYATISGNLDQWNIDNVYLNKGRVHNDTLFNDISWMYNGSSLLKNYRQMPWSQFTQNELATSITNLIRNNFPSKENVNYTYEIYNNSTATAIQSFNGSSNIHPFNLNKKYSDCDFPAGCIANIAINPSNFPSSFTDSTNITITHILKNGTFGDFSPKNDTLVVEHIFSNYFAYDDGTAEASVALNILDAQIAIPFTLNVADTLTSIDIYFNPVIVNAEKYAFILSVWNDNNGKPGAEIIRNSSIETPTYSRKGQNVFVRYYLNQKLSLSPGTYYIGFTQKTDQYLNVGLDENNSAKDKLFYNVGNVWQTSPYSGAAMMRPVMRGAINPNGIHEYAPKSNFTITLYPNPCTNALWIEVNNAEQTALNYSITDIYGRLLQQETLIPTQSINTASLANGVYFISVTDGQTSTTSKFIKTN